MCLLSCENISLGYEGKCIVKDIHFSIHPQDYVCIIGENGAGKSTLIKGILSLIKPMKGEIHFSNALLKNQIGYMPQQSPQQKDFPATVHEVVLSGFLNQLHWKPFYSKQQKEKEHQICKQLNIDTILNECYRELSGGQQQRVLLARALCATNQLLILDEPVAGLDPFATKNLYDLIHQINLQGIAIIMVSHDVHTCLKDATHVLQIHHKQLFYGTKQDYLQSPIGKQYLGDYTYD